MILNENHFLLFFVFFGPKPALTPKFMALLTPPGNKASAPVNYNTDYNFDTGFAFFPHLTAF